MARASNRKEKATRAAIYARVSDKSQDAEDKTSIFEQTSDMEAYCERNGLTIVARYQEVGRGWSKKRPEFQRMLADARQGRFDTIVCWKSDRLSRGMYPAAALMEVVEAHRLDIEAVMDAIDMKTFGLMAAVGKIELDNFRERSSMGKRGSAKQGRVPIGNVPYGYRVGEDGRPEVVESESEVVRRIYWMYVNEGKGAPAITRQLNAEDVPVAASGRRWWDGQVWRILSNETYKGTWWYGRARYVSTEEGMQVYEQPEDEWIGVPFPTLIDDETWEKARVIRNRRKTTSKRNTKVFYMLQHMVRCAECGFLMGGAANTKKEVKRNGKLYKYELNPPRRYYRCYGYQQMRLQCRPKPMIRAERLEGLVWGEVKKVLENPGLILAGIEAMNAQDDGGGLVEEIAMAERDLQRIQMEEDRAIRLYVSGKITEDQLDHQRRFITERLEMLRVRLAGYRSQQMALAEKRNLMENFVAWTEKMGDRLDDLTDEGRREVLRFLLDGASIDGENKVQITLAVPVDDFVSIEPPVSGYHRRTPSSRPSTAEEIARHYKPSAKQSGGWWRIPCPAHGGQGNNLALKDGDQGLALRCHSENCTYKAIITAFQADGLAVVRQWQYPNGKLVTRYDHDGKKTFKSPGSPKGQPVLLRGDLPDVLVVMPEGESDADAILSVAAEFEFPIAVASHAGGAGAAKDADYSALQGRRVAVWPDSDAQGRKFMEDAAAGLLAAGAAEILQIPEVATYGGGAADLEPEMVLLHIKSAELYEAPPVPAPNPPRVAWTSLKEILDQPPVVWLVQGLVAAGSTNLLFGGPKLGKSLLVFGIMKAGSRGREFLGHKVEPFTSWLFSEQSENSLSPQFRQLQFVEEEDIQVALRRNQPQWDTPEELADLILSEFKHAGRKPGLIVIDTLASFIDLQDSNDYSQVNQALAPIVELGQRLGKEYRTATIVTHHSRKSSGDGADSVLGSQAIAAKFDTLLKVSFTRGGSSRKIAIQSRFGIGELGTELEVTLNLPTGEYELLASASEIEGDIIAAVENGAHTPAEIREWLVDDADGEPAVSKQQVTRRLGKLVADTRLVRSGSGPATRYSLPSDERHTQ